MLISSWPGPRGFAAHLTEWRAKHAGRPSIAPASAGAKESLARKLA